MYVDVGFYGTKSTKHFLFVIAPLLVPCDARHGITNFHNYALGQLKAQLTRRTQHVGRCKAPKKKNAVDKMHTGTFDLTTSFIGAKSVGVAICVWSLYWYVFICSSGRFIPLTTPSESSWVQSSVELRKSRKSEPSLLTFSPDRGTGNVGPSLRFEPDQVGWMKFCLSKWGWQIFLFFFCSWKNNAKCHVFFCGGVYSVVFF